MNQRNLFQGQSGNVLRPILILSAILLLLWFITMSQSGSDVNTVVSVEDQVRIDSLRMIMGNTDVKDQALRDSDFSGNALPVFLILAVLIGGLWWWSSKNKPKANVITNVVAEQEIGPGQFIKVVSLGEDYLILGVTPQQINLLKTIPKAEWNLPLEPLKMESSSIFSQFMKRAEGKNES